MKLNFKSRTFILIIAVVIFATAFISFDNLVETQLLSKSYALIAGAILCSLFIALAPQKTKIRLDRLTLLIAIFTAYLLLRMLISRNLSINMLLVVAFLLMYFVFKVVGADYSKYINPTIIFISLSLSLYDLMQYADLLLTKGAFKMTDNFDNPAGLAACLSAGFPFCFALMRRSKWLKWFALISMMVITAAIVLSGSRAGIIAGVITVTLLIIERYKHLLKTYKIIVVFIVLLFTVGCTGLFFKKKDSALGRLLIWKISWNMIAEKPIAGHGPGTFLAQYMTYQAEYFKTHPDSKFAQLADNVTHPFNEYFSLTIEYGFIGLFILVGIIVLLIHNFIGTTPYLLSLISVSVFGCFSYPLRYAFVILILSYSLSQINCIKATEFRINIWLKTALIAAVAIISCRFINDIRFETSWGSLVRTGELEKTKEILPEYKELFRQWNHNPLFLYNYGAMLNRAEYYSTSTDIMNVCIRYFNDYDVQMLQGDNYLKLEEYQLALDAFQEASFMCPNRFLSLYKMMLVYDAMGQTDLSIELAKKIVSKKVKVPSVTVSLIQANSRQKLVGEY